MVIGWSLNLVSVAQVEQRLSAQRRIASEQVRRGLELADRGLHPVRLGSSLKVTVSKRYVSHAELVILVRLELIVRLAVRLFHRRDQGQDFLRIALSFV